MNFGSERGTEIGTPVTFEVTICLSVCLGIFVIEDQSSVTMLRLGGGLFQEIGHEFQAGVGGDWGGVVAGVERGEVDAGGAEGVEGFGFEAGLELFRGFLHEDDA